MFFRCLLPVYMHKEYSFFPTWNKYIFSMSFLFFKINNCDYNIKKNNHQFCFCYNHACDRYYMSAVTQCWTTQAFSPLFTYCRLTRVCNLTVSLPSRLMGQSSRWLFLCPDEMEKHWLTSEKSLAPSISLQSESPALSQAMTVRCFGPLKANGPNYTRGLKVSDKQGLGLFQVIQDRLGMSGKPIRDDLVQEWDHQLHKQAWLT